MRDAARLIRKQQIEQAAYALLEENGYAGMSMLGVAKRAKASNETLYRWYGDKQGLFKAMVARNAADVRALLEADLAAGRPPLEAIRALGPHLLALLVGNRAIALNRAAAADASGELGRALTEAGRDTILPLIVEVFVSAHAQGELPGMPPDTAVKFYFSLLIGDLQIRRAIGALPAPDATAIDERAAWAFTLLMRVAGPESTPTGDV